MNHFVPWGRASKLWDRKVREIHAVYFLVVLILAPAFWHSAPGFPEAIEACFHRLSCTWCLTTTPTTWCGINAKKWLPIYIQPVVLGYQFILLITKFQYKHVIGRSAHVQLVYFFQEKIDLLNDQKYLQGKYFDWSSSWYWCCLIPIHNQMRSSSISIRSLSRKRGCRHIDRAMQIGSAK